MKKVLVIGGGGMRGAIPTAVAVELERRTGKSCYQLFDLIAGTSIGGIVGALLSAGVPAKNAMNFFTEDGPVIFRGQLIDAGGFIGPRYAASTIEQCLGRRFGDLTLADCKTKLLVPSFDLAAQKPFFFKSYDPTQKFPLWQVGRGTSAAQTYFPAFPLNGMILWDGGNVANNPAVCAYADMVKLFGDQEDMRFLFLGCGIPPATLDALRLVNAGDVRNLFATLSVLFEASPEAADYQMEQILGNSYYNINPPLAEPLPLDDASPAGLAKLAAAGARTVTDFAPVLDAFLASI